MTRFGGRPDGGDRGRSLPGRTDLPALAASLQMEIDDLLPAADLLHLLQFAEVADGDISLADEGKRFVLAGFDERKGLFAQHVLAHIPLAAHIKHVLTSDRLTGRMRAVFVMSSRTTCQRRMPNRRWARSSRLPVTAKLLPTTKAATT
jgi:hypothetical protein